VLGKRINPVFAGFIIAVVIRMESYKAGAVTPNGYGFLTVWLRNGRVAPVHIPDTYLGYLKRGMRVFVHRNRGGTAVAYSFGGYMYFNMMPTTRDTAYQFIQNFKDIYSGSLDSVVFKYELNKALRKLEMRPTRSAVTNIMLYKDAHRKYQVQR